MVPSPELTTNTQQVQSDQLKNKFYPTSSSQVPGGQLMRETIATTTTASSDNVLKITSNGLLSNFRNQN